MSGGSHIVSLGKGDIPSEARPETAPDAALELTVETDGEAQLFLDEDSQPASRFGWIAPALALLAIAGWTGFFVWAHLAEMLAGASPKNWSSWIAQWAMPAVLVVGLWLLAMRSSRREALRFGAVARTLADESAMLEARLTTVNRELSLAREFLAAQSRDLESLGRVAGDRLSENAERMSALVHKNTAQIESIASVSTTALANMDKLRDELPVIATSARDVTSQIGNAGRTAKSQLDDMISGLQRMNSFGEAGMNLTEDMKEKVSATLSELENHTHRISQNASSVIADMNRQIDALRGECEAFAEAIEGRRVQHSSREAEEIQTFQSRIAELDSHISAHQQRHLAHVGTLTRQGEELAVKISQMSGQMEEIVARGGRIGEEFTQTIDLIAARLKTNQEIIQSTDQSVSDLTEASVRLLELVQAGAQHSREQLPSALALAEQRLADFETRTRDLGPMLDEVGEKGRTLSDYVLSARENGKLVIDELEVLHGSLAEQEDEHGQRIANLRSSIAALGAESDAVSRQMRGEMVEAVEKLQGVLQAAIDQLGTGDSQAIDELAGRIGAQSAEAIERAIRLRAAEAIGELEQAAAHASGVGREAARQLRDQLAKVDELAGNLENRVARARQRAEEQVDNDFARRVALITESLNSNAIDIAKVLSNDVTDTAWAAYLRGDRGIFTRRAVRLLDTSQAREIAEIYDQDRDFREHVSRYIHDFEAMLRSLLSTRDGNAMGVTLLSSDMGKLYVALAQAIERLRD